ncbi:glycoside hydrolase family 38 C-terminal domain-containing protein [uncultured Fibrobacter sp.]|uniref:glycoside hydrolase family 38 C-terminal domain-containing protein n=1 Tax=uncultured Fibrobacter sp. TaxID=261512 RepID=UPI002614B986|nr:glycoside hydrolase family 38 C-terminal domain-containing protein [uncultured Fibrobacter sp.]
MENEYIKAEINANGTITLTEKTTGRVFENLNYFEETGDQGDYWIYYPPYHNKTYTSLGASAEIWCEENTTLSATICFPFERTIISSITTSSTEIAEISDEIVSQSCVNRDEIEKYKAQGKGKLYAWHIVEADYFGKDWLHLKDLGAKRAPQSWQFVR